MACIARNRKLVGGMTLRQPATLAGLVLLSLGVIVGGPSHAADSEEPRQSAGRPGGYVLAGKVTGIVDGDTLHLNSAKGEYQVDLAGVDAPEKGQPSGDMAAQMLHYKVFDKRIEVYVLSPAPRIGATPTTQKKADSKTAPRHQVRGIVYFRGCVNTSLVREGLAWHNDQEYRSEVLATAQRNAHKGRHGLWSIAGEPIPPWQWRRQQIRVAQSGDKPPRAGRNEVEDLSRFFEAEKPTGIGIGGRTAVGSGLAASMSRVAGGYWLSENSGVRHNSTCRYYQKSKGRPCTAAEGRPCKVCGG